MLINLNIDNQQFIATLLCTGGYKKKNFLCLEAYIAKME